MVRIAIVGIGKMGLSHLSMLRAHPQVDLVGVCDQAGYVLDVLGRYTGLKTFTDYELMLDSANLDAVVIATPTTLHFPMVSAALKRGIHVFCEKPLSLSSAQSRQLAELAALRSLVTQVGYHNRFVGAFQEVRRLIDLDAIGNISHALAESYGPVVLREKGSTWRSKRNSGGGCLYDYAAHPIDLLQWYLGEPAEVRGTSLNRVFSAETEDEVYSTLLYENGRSAQLSVNWSDESHRKMTTRITLWGRNGRITADRQECQVYLRDTAAIPEGYQPGWNVRYTTELTKPVWFYLRGEEYSAQLDHFVTQVDRAGSGLAVESINGFDSAGSADQVIEWLLHDASSRQLPEAQSSAPTQRIANPRTRSWTQKFSRRGPAARGAERS